MHTKMSLQRFVVKRLRRQIPRKPCDKSAWPDRGWLDGWKLTPLRSASLSRRCALSRRKERCWTPEVLTANCVCPRSGRGTLPSTSPRDSRVRGWQTVVALTGEVHEGWAVLWTDRSS